MFRRNIKIIKKGSIIGTILVASIIALCTSLLYFEQKTFIYTLLAVTLLGFGIFYLFFIPQAQRIEITRLGIQFYSCAPHRQCRTYFWKQIKDVLIENHSDNNTRENTRIILQVFRSGALRSNPESFFEVPVTTEVYGYTPEELYAIIKRNIAQQVVDQPDQPNQRNSNPSPD